MPPAERARAVVSLLREVARPMKTKEIAEKLSITHKSLTGDTVGTLFLLEAEGLVGRTGRTKGTIWFATEEVS